MWGLILGNQYRTVLSVLFSVLSLSFSEIALSGAWLPPKDSGVVIIMTTQSKSDLAYSSQGLVGASTDFSKTESSFYTERGLSDKVAFVGSVSLQQQKFLSGSSVTSYFGLGEASLGLRIKAYQKHGFIMSIQPSMLYTGQNEKFSTLDQRSIAPNAELRALIGYGRTLKNIPVYFDMQIARKFGFETVPNETRVDMTLGMKPWEKIEVTAQAYHSETDLLDQSPRIALPTQSLKGQMSVIYHRSPVTAFQVGIIQTLDGKNIIKERAITAGIWRTF